jgi:hypothetical protein
MYRVSAVPAPQLTPRAFTGGCISASMVEASWRVSLSRGLTAVLVLTGAACTRPPPPEPSAPGSQPGAHAAPPAQVLVVATQDGVPKPVMRQENYRFEAGPYALEVSPSTGAQILEFSLNGRNVLVAREESPAAFGSTFYPSPQSDWNWPPPFEWDALPWTVAVTGETLLLQSRTSAKFALGATQRIRLDGVEGVARIDYSITNFGQSARKVAPWQNTRVRPKGLTFFPCSGGALSLSSLEVEPQDGVMWLAHDPAGFTESKKLFADGREGWVAHVDGDLMFVKVFPDVPPAEQAPNEAEIEIYVHSSGLFVEVEQQGPYVELGSGNLTSWCVRWIVRKLPPEIDARPGQEGLLHFARELAATARSSRS